MILGGYTFAKNPSRITGLIRKEKRAASVSTHGGAVYIEWGTFWQGKKITLEWSKMPATMYDALETLYLASGAHVFDPQDGKGLTFNVVILPPFDGAYFLTLKDTMYGKPALRENVVMHLRILSLVI